MELKTGVIYEQNDGKEITLQELTPSEVIYGRKYKYVFRAIFKTASGSNQYSNGWRDIYGAYKKNPKRLESVNISKVHNDTDYGLEPE